MNRIKDISLEAIPSIDLYIDQVVEIFGDLEGEGEKNLTKSMINNYSKAKVIKPIKGRKYPPAHVVVIAMINRLKSTLSISQIKDLLDNGGDLIIEGDQYSWQRVSEIYSLYLDITAKGTTTEKLKELLAEKEKSLPKAPYNILKSLCYSKLSQELALEAAMWLG